ncbi:MAG: GatB/YqeY domain-containing protein [Pseudomonadota bacterium]
MSLAMKITEDLPAQLTAAEIEEVLREIITELSVSNLKDLGKVMKVAVARTAGRAQGKEVNEIARRLLG